MDALGVGAGPLPEPQARAAWRLLCGNWHVLRGTSVRFWFEAELADIFGVTQRPSAANADALYDRIADALRRPDHRPRALLRRFDIEFLATTDDPADAAAIYARARAGEVTVAEATAFRRHMMIEMARMSCEDGLVMTLHPGIHRNHHPPTSARFGPDTGHDIPVAVEYTRALQPLLERFGTHPDLHLVLFTVDLDVFSREIAPLAGFYPSVYAGAPWWFLVVPGQPDRDPGVPRGGHRDRGAQPAVWSA